MRLKVCGLTNAVNIKKVDLIYPEMKGFIFVPESPRFIELDDELIHVIKKSKNDTVGVFVNESINVIKDLVEVLELDFVQLHGDETPEQLREISKFCKVIKAFSVDADFDFNIEGYEAASLVLFDTKGNRRGGNGVKFNWNLLKKYKGTTPFLLSGGIRLSDAYAIRKIDHPLLYGIDINSGFELSPGVKNIDLIAQLKLELDEVYS